MYGGFQKRDLPCPIDSMLSVIDGRWKGTIDSDVLYDNLCRRAGCPVRLPRRSRRRQHENDP